MPKYTEVALIYCMTFDFYEYMQHEMHSDPLFHRHRHNTLYRRIFTRYTEALEYVDWTSRLEKVRRNQPGFYLFDEETFKRHFNEMLRKGFEKTDNANTKKEAFDSLLHDIISETSKKHDICKPQFRDNLLLYKHCNHHKGILGTDPNIGSLYDYGNNGLVIWK